MHQSEAIDVKLSHYIVLFLALAATAPGLYLGITHTPISPVTGAILFGLAVFGAAFVLSWAAEAAQIDISESLAVAILALIAVEMSGESYKGSPWISGA